MNHAAHSATGALAGILATAAASGLTGQQPTAAALATGGLVAAGAALLPDLDHDGSTATRSGGWITRLLAEVLQACSRLAYRATRTRHDPSSDGEHRQLWHAPSVAVALGLAVAATPTLANALGSPISGQWALSALLWLCLAPALHSLAASLPAVLRRTLLLRHRLAVAVYATAGTYALLWLGHPPDHVAVTIGACLTAGMLAHDLGDAATHTGIPLAWPIPLYGQRWKRLGLPRPLRFSTGSAIEKAVHWTSLLAATGTAYLLTP